MTADLEPALPPRADVVIVGSGAAGMCAAIALKKAGLSPVILEKTEAFGGSTAISGGAVWIPCNPHSEGVGRPDDKDAARAYLRAEIGNRMNQPLVDAFLDAGPEMVRFLEAETEVRFAARALGPDYHPDLPGGSLGGRVMDPLDYDAGRLGPALQRLRRPIKEFTVMGMMVGRADLGHLPKMFRSRASFAYAMRVFARHGMDMLRHGRGARSVLGNALAARLGKTVHDLGVPIHYHAGMTGLIRDGAGAIVGVETPRGAVLASHGVLLAAGGAPQDAALRAQLMPHVAAGANHWSMSPEGNSGDGLRAAEALGAARGLDNLHPAFWTPVSRLRRRDGTVVSFPHLFLDRAKPGLIAITDRGERFVNESASYHDFVAGMLDAMKGGAKRFWLLADRRFVRRYGIGAVRPFPGRIAPFVAQGYLTEAKDAGAMGAALGLPEGALAATLAAFNGGAGQGEDPAFGKGGTAYNRYLGDAENAPNPCLRPIGLPGDGALYAVEVHAGDIGASVGLVTDAQARVLGKDGAPIAGLYAAGNDMNSIMAGSYPGPGITLGPALTFGFIAARDIAARARGGAV